MRKKIIAFIVISYLLMHCSTFSNAGSNKKEEEWNPPSAGPITTWTAPVCDQGKLSIQPFFWYKRTRGAFDEEDHYKSFKNKDRKWQYLEQLFLQYGLADRLELSGLGEFQQNFQHQDGASAEDYGFSDTYIYVHYCMAEETKWLPCTTALFQLKLPTGKYQKADEGKLGTDLMGATTGGGSYEHGYGINLTKRIKPFTFHADVTFNFPIQTRVGGVKTRYGNFVNCDFGAEYFLPRGFNLMVELNLLSQGDRREDSELVPASDVKQTLFAAGAGWSNDAIQTLLAYQRTIAGTNVDVNDSLVFTFIYTF